MINISGEVYKRFPRIENLDAVDFYNCKFLNCEIPSTSQCTFRHCTFEEVTFPVKNFPHSFSGFVNRNFHLKSRAYAKDVLFHDCRFRNMRVVGADILDIRFVRCRFQSVAIDACTLNGELLLEKCAGIASFDIKQTNRFGQNFFDEVIECEVGLAGLLSWSKVRWISSLPLAKIGFGLFSVYVLCFPIINYFLFALASRCAEFSASFSELTSVCRYFPSKITLSYSEKIFIGNSLLIAVSAILHKSLQPSSVAEYSFEAWKTETSHSKIQYIFADNSRAFARALVMFFYLVAISVYIYIYCLKFVSFI